MAVHVFLFTNDGSGLGFPISRARSLTRANRSGELASSHGKQMGQFFEKITAPKASNRQKRRGIGHRCRLRPTHKPVTFRKLDQA